MLKAGIFVDAENVARNGGWGMKYGVLKDFVEAQHASLLRAAAYMAADREREKSNEEFRRKKEAFRAAIRRFGFKLILKPVKRFVDEDGETVTKANADLDLGVDMILQARNLDYVVLVSGDGDFVRVVEAIQGFGCRVDVIGFNHTSRELREAADNYYSGFMIDGLIPTENGRRRGYLMEVKENYYGWIVYPASLKVGDFSQVFCHGTDVENGAMSQDQLESLKGPGNILEFDLENSDKGMKAVRVTRVTNAGAA